MDPSSTDAARPRLEVRGPSASSVVVHRVPPDGVERFLEWERGITRAAEGFPGYRATDLYPPADRRQAEWVAVIHFDTPEALQRWIDSPARAEWTGKLPREIGDFQLKTLPAGFGPWFAGLVRGPGGGLPPSWKMALAVLLALYPTVMVLTIFVSPVLSPLGFAVSMLIGNALSVALLQWALMPVVEAVLRPWLRAKADQGMALSVGGLLLILFLLAGMAVLFRQVTG
jgi:antibiotic biosynthesis monooxygenase (ABM) superfamily enzyme